MKKTAAEQLVTASSVVNKVCDELEYTRPHVIKLLKQHKRMLGAQKKGGRWKMPAASADLLKQIVAQQSGRRYKLGETGAH